MDLDSLKTSEALEKYCQKRLGDWKLHGREKRFRCPFGNHTKLHLAIAEVNGVGVWKCRACDTGGDIFKLVGLLESLDMKTQFRDILRSVADVLSVPMEEESESLRRRKGKESTRKRRLLPEPAKESPPPVQYVSAEDNEVLEACRWRLIEDRELRNELAEELGLCGNELLARASFVNPYYGGLVGATPDRRLLFLYSIGEVEGTGVPRYTGAKLRRRGLPHRNTFLRLKEGNWEGKGSMNASANNPEGVRFLWCTGKAYEPWGMNAAKEKRGVIVCEGESDAMAMSQALDVYRAAYQQDVDPETGLPYEDETGSMEGSIPAVVAVPGAKNFPDGWKGLMSGKVVIICMDADEAGQEGSRRLISLLEEVPCVLRVWNPSLSYKDAREMLRGAGFKALCESLFSSIKHLSSHNEKRVKEAIA